jgi:LacI family transcriptional regulator
MSLVSIKDIAREVGVSTTTVSFVLNGKAREKRISEELKVRIEETAQRLNYRPNHVARGLRTGQSHTLGLIVEDISNPFFAHLARHVEHEADRSGYTVMFCSTENDEPKAERLVYMMRHRQMDGFIIVPTPGMQEEVGRLVEMGKPVVLVDRYFPGLDICHVAVDNYRGAREAVSLLVGKGYRRIGIVTLESSQTQMREREQGFRDAMSDQGLEVTEGRVLHIPFDSTDGQASLEISGMLYRESDMDAVFFTTNYLGVSGLEAIRNSGKRIPTDMGVVSFDDSVLFRLGSPTVSVVSQPIREMGRAAVRMILAMIRKEMPNPKTLILPPVVQVREST